jgi:hypothetical protein
MVRWLGAVAVQRQPRLLKSALQYATGPRSYRESDPLDAIPIEFYLVRNDKPDKVLCVKAIQFLPLAYLADVHGFIYFVPYMLFVMAIAQMMASSRRRAARVAQDTRRGPVGALASNDAVLAAVGS